MNGQTAFLSNNLNESQHELAEYAIASWQHSEGALNWQTSLSVRYTSLHYAPDWVGDFLYNGLAQDAFKSDTAMGWQTDGSYQLNDAHTMRAGLYYQHDSSKSDTSSQVLPIDATGAQTSNVPLSVIDNGTQIQQIESVYLQDEWKPLSPLTLNYGLRYDHYSAYSSGGQVSPRVNFVWEFPTDTTLHGGYSRYFTPPPFELVGSETFTKFAGTTALPPGSNTQNTPPIAERANYYDLGVQQKLLDRTLTLGVDSFYEQSQHLIDEGQFGAPIILTPFNYRYGLIGGVEFTANYTINNFAAYLNSAWQAAHGKGVESAQFNFSQDGPQLHCQKLHPPRSRGDECLPRVGCPICGWGLASARMRCLGADCARISRLPTVAPCRMETTFRAIHRSTFGLTHDFEIAGSGPLTVRFDVINVADKVYQIRSSSGVGVFASQYGQRRGFFGGLAWKF